MAYQIIGWRIKLTRLLSTRSQDLWLRSHALCTADRNRTRVYWFKHDFVSAIACAAACTRTALHTHKNQHLAARSKIGPGNVVVRSELLIAAGRCTRGSAKHFGLHWPPLRCLVREHSFHCVARGDQQRLRPAQAVDLQALWSRHLDRDPAYLQSSTSCRPSRRSNR